MRGGLYAEVICGLALVHICLCIIARSLPGVNSAVDNLDILNTCPEVGKCLSGCTADVRSVENYLCVLCDAVAEHVVHYLVRCQKVVCTLLASCGVLHLAVIYIDSSRDMSLIVGRAVCHVAVAYLRDQDILISLLVTVQCALYPLGSYIHGSRLHRLCFHILC